MKKRVSIKSLFTFILGWPLSLIAVYFIYQRVAGEKDTIFQQIRHINLLLVILGILCFISYYYLRGLIWYRLLRGFAVRLSFKESTSLWAVTQLKRYIPGNIWSFLGLTVLLGKKGIERKHILQAILFEQQLVVLTAPCVALLGLPFLFHYILSGHYRWLQSILPFVLLGFLLLYVYNATFFARWKGKIAGFLHHFLPAFSPKTNALLLFLMGLSFFILGAGYYFVIISVTYLTPALFFQIIGLTVFSLLVGFLSFITPTGLGVREGVLTVALTKVMDIGLAGFISLFSRIVLILSELLFVAIAYGWEKAKHTRIVIFERFVQQHMHVFIVLLFVAIYCIYFSAASFLRYDNFFTGKYDLGNMSQTVWNTAQGNIFQMTDPTSTRVMSRLGFHADFFLVLLAPFYYIWESPKVLLLVQVVVIACGAFFAYLLTKEILKNKTVAVLVALCYLLNPGLQWTNLYDFHAVSLATTFLLACFYFIITKRYWWFLLFAVLAGFTKEEVWFVIALFGLYLFIFQKKRLLGGSIFLTSLFLFYSLLWHAIPNASGSSSHFALSYYEDGGDSPSSLIKNTLLSPVKTFQTITDHDRITYMKQLFMPLGYLSFFGLPFLIFASADLGINLLSSKGELHQIYYQYTAVITPFLFIAALYGIKLLKKYIPALSYTGIGLYMVITTVYSAYLFGPLPGMRHQNIDMFTRPQENRDFIMQTLSAIPQNKSVSATNNLGAHLSHRQRLYVIPFGIDSADYVVFLFTSNTWSPQNPEYQTFQKVSKDKNYQRTISKGFFFVFRRA